MTVEEAQLEVRSVFMGGLVGQLVSGALWLASAAVGTWGSTTGGIAVLCVGGALIFPLTQLALRAMGRPASLRADNPLSQLAMQIAFTIPLSLPLVGAATIHRLNWFYPATMIVVGAHYLPFVFLYGMKHFAVLCGLMVAGGVMLGLYFHHTFSLGGWLTAAMLVVFGIAGGALSGRERTVRPAA
jgi:Family of unknown function (DUF7010)